MLLKGAFLYCTMNAPNHGIVGRLPDLTLSATNTWIGEILNILMVSYERTSPIQGLVGHLSKPNLSQYMLSQTHTKIHQAMT
jgi:hypothetical protein